MPAAAVMARRDRKPDPAFDLGAKDESEDEIAPLTRLSSPSANREGATGAVG